MIYGTQSFSHYCGLHDWHSEGLPDEIRCTHITSLDNLVGLLMNHPQGFRSLGIPVAFERDQIQFGKLLNKYVVNCVVLKNMIYPTEYFHFTFTFRTTGNASFIRIYRTGHSRLNEQHNIKESRRESTSLVSNIVGAATKMNYQSFQTENDYYTMVSDVIKHLLMI